MHTIQRRGNKAIFFYFLNFIYKILCLNYHHIFKNKEKRGGEEKEKIISRFYKSSSHFWQWDNDKDLQIKQREWNLIAKELIQHHIFFFIW